MLRQCSAGREQALNKARPGQRMCRGSRDHATATSLSLVALRSLACPASIEPKMFLLPCRSRPRLHALVVVALRPPAQRRNQSSRQPSLLPSLASQPSVDPRREQDLDKMAGRCWRSCSHGLHSCMHAVWGGPQTGRWQGKFFFSTFPRKIPVHMQMQMQMRMRAVESDEIHSWASGKV